MQSKIKCKHCKQSVSKKHTQIYKSNQYCDDCIDYRCSNCDIECLDGTIENNTYEYCDNCVDICTICGQYRLLDELDECDVCEECL